MTKNYKFHFKNISNVVLMLLIGASCTANAQSKRDRLLFTSSVLTPVNSFTTGVEGPAVDKKGNLYAVNYQREGTIGIVTPDGKADLFVNLPEGSIGNGIRFDSKGNMLIADYTMHNILKVDMASNKITVFAHNDKMSQPNDIAIDNKDRLYASDPNWKAGTGRIWRIDTDGKFTLLDSMATVNGIDVSPDQKTLYVNELLKIWAYSLSSQGEISDKRLLIEFPDFGMDGLRVDVDGNIYQARYGKGVVAKISPQGKLLKEIVLKGKKPTNIAFGGSDGCTMYVTLQDERNLETFRVDRPGREWLLNNKSK